MGDSEAKRAVRLYWKLVGSVSGVALLLALLGFAVPSSFGVAAAIVLVMPVFQAIASIVMFTIPDRAARRAALIVTLLWLVLTGFGAWLTVSVFDNMMDDLAKVPITPP